MAASWVPIGNPSSNYFKGTFDGKDKTISNLAVTSDFKYSGLFGSLSGATLKDFTLSHATIKIDKASTGCYCGFIVGESSTSTLTGLTASGGLKMAATVSSNSYFGGITGSAASSSIVNCTVPPNGSAESHILVTSSSTYRIGGITGSLSNSQAVNCFSTANVEGIATGSAKVYVGGVCGTPPASAGFPSKIFNSYSSGTVTFTPGTGIIYAGGLVATLDEVSLSNCYALGAGVTNTLQLRLTT